MENKENLVGVVQIKIFNPNNISELNKFIYENRFTCHIVKINYCNSYISVEYCLLNDKDKNHSKVMLESYQMNYFGKHCRS